MRFLVVGPVGRPRVEGSLVETWSVPDLGLYLRASDLALVPIVHGGGTKIKLLESLAAGLPTVAFEAALDGTDSATANTFSSPTKRPTLFSAPCTPW